MFCKQRTPYNRNWQGSIITIVVLCHCLSAMVTTHAQEHIPMSLPDTGIIRQMIRDAMHIVQRDPDSAMVVVSKAEYYSRQSKFNAGTFSALNVRAYFLRRAGLYDSSITVLKQAITYTHAPERIGYRHTVYNNLAMAASNIGQYDKALQYYIRALEAMHVKRSVDKDSRIDSCTVLINMAVMWARLGENGQSVTLLKEAEEIAIKQKSWYGMTQACLNMGEVFFRNKEYDTAIYYFRRGLQLTEYRDENNSRFYAMGGLAHAYLALGQTDSALRLLCDTAALNKLAYVGAYNYLYWQHSLGLAYFQQKKYEQAFVLLGTLLDSAVSLNHDELIQMIAPDAANAASAAGHYQDAYNFMHVYASLRDSMFERGKVRFLHAWSNARVAEKDKMVFAQKLYISRQRGQIQARNFMIAVGGGGMLLLLVIGLWWYRSHRHRQSIQQAGMQQLQQQQEIGRLKARVQGEEQERNRIAVELHNGIAAQLWGVRMNMDIFQRQAGLNVVQQGKLQVIYNQLEEAAKDIRNTAHNMLPALLLNEGLGVALASLCAKAGINTGLETEYQEYGNVPRLDPEIEHLLYRMVQELVQNTMKHALTASHLLVQLSCSDTILNVTVEDNGQGFTWTKQETGIGLQHICHNVQILGGSIDIKSSPGAGTAIYMEFDIQHLL